MRRLEPTPHLRSLPRRQMVPNNERAHVHLLLRPGLLVAAALAERCRWEESKLLRKRDPPTAGAGLVRHEAVESNGLVFRYRSGASGGPPIALGHAVRAGLRLCQGACSLTEAR